MPTNLTHFLLVEDDDDHANIVFRSMRQERIANRIDHVKNGVDALAFLRRQGKFADAERPDIILLDLKLPMLSGHEVLSAAKEDPALRDIPVVILTTSDAQADIAKAYKHHANSYLIKPLDAARFRKMVEDLRLYWGVWNRGVSSGD